MEETALFSRFAEDGWFRMGTLCELFWVVCFENTEYNTVNILFWRETMALREIVMILLILCHGMCPFVGGYVYFNDRRGAHSISVLLYCISGEKSTYKMYKYRGNVYLFLGSATFCDFVTERPIPS